jgi:methylglutaconyl-CoA hydratase
MSDPTLQLEKDPRGFATLWLNRPQRHNAFDARMIGELIAALDEIATDASLRFLLLRGRGRHFCAGADLDWMRQAAQLDIHANLADAEQLAQLMYDLQALPLPCLAVVQGAAFGGALGLVACCDIAIGSEDALFALSEVRIGLAPAVISPFLVQAIGERATRRYALSAERFDARRACELGLLAECCPAAELQTRVDYWIAQLLQSSPQAMRATKALLREVGPAELSAELRRSSETAIARLRVSPEGQEGLAAFFDKRPPAWQADT